MFAWICSEPVSCVDFSILFYSVFSGDKDYTAFLSYDCNVSVCDGNLFHMGRDYRTEIRFFSDFGCSVSEDAYEWGTP